jgi:hypothetical protein
MWCLQVAAGCRIVFGTTLGSQTSPLRDRELFATTNSQTWAADLQFGGFCRLLKVTSRWRTLAAHSAHFLARAFRNSFTFCIDVVIQAAPFELLALIGLGKLFANFLRDAYLLGERRVVCDRLHHAVLGR